MGAPAKDKSPPNKLDPAMWIPRKEAARILKVSLPTILSWAGPRFRVAQVKTKSRIKWFVHAADVERVRLQRIGPTMHELESFVLAELAAGSSASEIVRSGHQVTLGDVERVRDLDARLSGGFVVDAAVASELRQLLGVASLDAPYLLAQVRALIARTDLLAARLNGAKVTLDVRKTAAVSSDGSNPPTHVGRIGDGRAEDE